jgi:hypothetical protein
MTIKKWIKALKKSNILFQWKNKNMNVIGLMINMREMGNIFGKMVIIIIYLIKIIK